MTRGRPLRFLAAVLGGWTALRVAMLWPDPPATADAGSPAAWPHPAAPAWSRVVSASTRVTPAIGHAAAPVARHRPDGRTDGGTTPQASPIEPARAVAGDPDPVPPARSTPLPETGVDAGLPPTMHEQRLASRESRLHGDAWLVARPSNGDSLAFGQLGASQAGVRLTYLIDRGRRIALSARASAPFRDRGREVAAGVDWRPLRLPLHLLAEERIDLETGHARPALEAIGGLYATLPVRLTLEAYAQAGVVGGRGSFTDGAARVSRTLARAGALRVELGGGAWGGAQRGAARLDLGPSAALVLPLGRASARLGLDYRARVAGRARPGSGPALSLGAGF